MAEHWALCPIRTETAIDGDASANSGTLSFNSSSDCSQRTIDTWEWTAEVCELLHLGWMPLGTPQERDVTRQGRQFVIREMAFRRPHHGRNE